MKSFMRIFARYESPLEKIPGVEQFEWIQPRKLIFLFKEFFEFYLSIP